MKTLFIDTTCPKCGAKNDAMTDIAGEDAPNDGDFVICFDCGEVLIFEQGKLREPFVEEADELATDSTVQAVLDAWRANR